MSKDDTTRLRFTGDTPITVTGHRVPVDGTPGKTVDVPTDVALELVATQPDVWQLDG